MISAEVQDRLRILNSVYSLSKTMLVASVKLPNIQTPVVNPDLISSYINEELARLELSVGDANIIGAAIVQDILAATNNAPYDKYALLCYKINLSIGEIDEKYSVKINERITLKPSKDIEAISLLEKYNLL